MSFLSTPYEIFEDGDFRRRVLVAAVQAGADAASLEYFYSQNGLAIAAKPDIVEAYEYAKRAQPYHARLCFDAEIITDGMITAAVAAALEAQAVA